MEGFNIKTIKDEFKAKGIFYTPPELGEFLKKYIDIEGFTEVYDPTCGHGGLLSLFDESVAKYGQDINKPAIDYIRENHPEYNVELADTLEVDAFPDKKFKLILANPPFSVSYNHRYELLEDPRFKECGVLAPKTKADYMFNLHVLHKLADDGQALVLNFPGILYRKSKEGDIRKWIIEKNYIDKVIMIPPKQFTDTTIATVLISYKKNKTTTDIHFIDIEYNTERMVPIEEIRENDYNLNNQIYLERPRKKENEYNPETEDEIVRKASLTNLEMALNMEFLVLGIFDTGFDYMNYLNEIKKIVKTYEDKYLLFKQSLAIKEAEEEIAKMEQEEAKDGAA